MVTVALPEPEPVQPPAVVIATGKPDVAVATTGNVLLYAALAGAEVVTLIVWLVKPLAVVLLETSGAAL